MTTVSKNNSTAAGEYTKPRAPKVRPWNIPDGLQTLPQWVVWRYEWRDDKWTKVPYQARTSPARLGASSTDPRTWCSLPTALAKYRAAEGWDGVGFVARPEDNLAMIDLDKCRNPDTEAIQPWAEGIVAELDSYTELSVSRTGLHIFVHGRKPDRQRSKRGRVEIYDGLTKEGKAGGRFFTFTGHRLKGAPREVRERQEALARVYGREVRGAAKATPAVKTDVRANGKAPAGRSDDEVAALASKQFPALWGGNTAGYQSQSEAELALCGRLADWTLDKDQIFRVVKRSGLYREKWERADYREATIAKALEGRGTRPVTNSGRPDGKPDLAHPDGRTDLANGRRLVARHGDKLRWCDPWHKWLVWDGTRWKVDDACRAEALAKEVAGGLWGEAAAAMAGLTKEGLTAAQSYCKSSNGAKGVENMLKMAHSEPGIPVLPDGLDKDKWLLNCVNGTLDLRTGELRAHRQEDYLTKLCPVEYHADAECPTWKGFLDRIMAGNKGMIGYLRRVVGYCLTGDVGEQCLWFLHGGGANGKSTFLGTLLALLGDYGHQAPSELLMAKRNEAHPTERADLQGKRLVATVEVDQGRRFAESLVKQLTGGDKVTARRMREDFWTFEPTHKILLAANHKPDVAGTDLAMWRRIKLVPFEVTIPEAERDKALPEKLKQELPGILAWAVRGCREWQREGLGEPEEVTRATDAYRAEQDTLAEFLAERCEPSGKVRLTKVIEAYHTWTGDKTVSPQDLARRLREKGYTVKAGKGNAQFCHGLGLRFGDEND
jgi:putative DNA primase/helicase